MIKALLERHGRKVAVCFAVAIPVLLLASAVAAWRTSDFLATAEAATGTVVELVPQDDPRGRTSYRTRFAWTDTRGRPRQTASSWAHRPAAHSVGDSVDVLYDPARPEEARIGTFFSLWGVSVITAGLVPVIAFIACRAWVGEKPRPRAR